MDYPLPKRPKKVTWTVSERARALVKAYSKYSERPEDEIVDICLQVLNKDPRFRKWLLGLRDNKRLLRQIDGPPITENSEEAYDDSTAEAE